MSSLTPERLAALRYQAMYSPGAIPVHAPELLVLVTMAQESQRLREEFRIHYESLERERDALRVRVAALEGALGKVVSQGFCPWLHADAGNDPRECRADTEAGEWCSWHEAQRLLAGPVAGGG